MKWISMLWVGIALSVLAGSALCADWKVYNISPVNGIESFLFYDLESIETNKEKVRLWLQQVPQEEMYGISKDDMNIVYENTKAQLAYGYIPPLAVHNNTNDDLEISALISFEERLLVGRYKPTSKSLLEIDCYKEMTRVISKTVYQEPGGESVSSPETWEHISPGSAVDTLKKMACKSNSSKKSTASKKK